MAKTKVTQDGAGEDAGAALELARRRTTAAIELAQRKENVGALRALAAYANALRREMEEEDPDAAFHASAQDSLAKLLAMPRATRIGKMLRLMGMLPDPADRFRAARGMLPLLAPEIRPSVSLSLRDLWARGLLPSFSPADNDDRKLHIQLTLNAMRKSGHKISKKEEKRFRKTHGEMPTLPTDPLEIAAMAARSLEWSSADIDRVLYNVERVQKHRLEKRKGKAS